MKQVFTSNKAPQAIGPYSSSIKISDQLFISGQIGISRETGALVSNDISEQTHQIFKNLEFILKSAGLTINDIFKITVYLTDLNQFNLLNEIFKQYFKAPYPARTVVGVNALPYGGLVQLDCIADMD